MTLPRAMVPMQMCHVEHLAMHARDDERAQWEYFTAKPYNPDDVVCYIACRKGPAFTVLGADGLPIAAGGYFWIAPGVWQSFMLGTPEGWRTHWRTLTKAARWLMSAMLQIGAQRLETHVQPSRVKTCEWYERALGMRRVSDGLYVRTA